MRGIYLIRRKDTSEIVYVGQSRNVEARWASYRQGNFHNHLLRSLAIEIGVHNLSFELLEETDILTSLDERESHYISLYQPTCNIKDGRIQSAVLDGYGDGSFFGVAVPLVMIDGNPYYPVANLLDILGLSHRSRTMMHQHPLISKHVKIDTTLREDGSHRDTLCIRAIAVPWWLMTVSPDLVHPQKRGAFIEGCRSIMESGYLGGTAHLMDDE